MEMKVQDPDRRTRVMAVLDLASSLGCTGLLAWIPLSFRRAGEVEYSDPWMRDSLDWTWLAILPGVVMTANSIVALHRAWKGLKPGIPGIVGSGILATGILASAAVLLLAGVDWARGWEHLDIGTKLNDRGRHAEAIPHFEKAIEILGEDPEALVGLGLACVRASDLDRARDCFDRALAAQPYDPLAHLGRARVLRLRGDLAGARADLETARTCAPEKWIEAPFLDEETKALAP